MKFVGLFQGPCMDFGTYSGTSVYGEPYQEPRFRSSGTFAVDVDGNVFALCVDVQLMHRDEAAAFRRQVWLDIRNAVGVQS